jgi:hypothetical protein
MMIVSPVFSGEPDKKLHEKCIYPTVMIINGSGRGSSTGTIIRSEKIEDGKYHNVAITTAHGLEDKLIVNVPSYKDWSEISGTTMFPGLMYYVNKDADLAIVVFISRKVMPTADLGFKEKIYLGNKIMRIGCGLGDSPRLEFGTISGISLRSGVGTNKIHRMSIYTLPGDSGGAVYHNYKIVGFTQSIRSGQQTNPFVSAEKYYNYAMAIRLADLSRVIASEKGGLDFVRTKEKLPVFTYFKLKIEYLNQDQRAIPANPWIDN